MLFRRKKNKFRWSLSIKIITIISLIAVVFWGISASVTNKYLKNTLWNEFNASNSNILRILGRQVENEIIFADFIQILRTLRDTYDDDYMNYIAVYNQDLKPLAVYPKELPGNLSIIIDENVLAETKAPESVTPYKYNGCEYLHLQQIIYDDSGNKLGYIAMGASTTKIADTLRKQKYSFTFLGLLLLVIQIIVLIYISNIITKPLRNLTKSLIGAENKQPDEIIPTLLREEPHSNASSEVHLFYKTYIRLLKEIQRHQENAKQMAIQAAIGKVASHIAHDMRSPLSVIKAALNPELTNDPDKKLLISTGLRSATKLDHMADDLLDYSKARVTDKCSTNITKMINDVVKEVKEVAKHEGKQIIYSVTDTEKHYANVDPIRLNRVITNLLTNAAQAIKHKNGKIDIAIEAEGKDLVIKIRDNGEGISEEHLPHLFNTTFTFGKKSGSGLGLSYCRNVIEAHGGEISAESVFGEGSTFLIRIPDSITDEVSVVQKIEHEDTADKKISTTKKVLVMDDEEELMITWRIKLKQVTGRTPIEIAEPEKLLESNIDSNSVDLAIIDYEFRGSSLNGLDVLEYLKHKGVKELYLCTAYYQDKEIKDRAEKLGIRRIIPKPIPDNILREIL